MTALRFCTLEKVDTHIQKILEACEQSMKKVAHLASSSDPVDWFYDVKFGEIGHDGLFNRPQNLIEQVNQTFTYLVTLQGIKYLLAHYPKDGPYKANLGARSGPDISSENGAIIAEVFAAIKPTNNNKLREDLKRCSEYSASHKYVFFYSPGIPAGVYHHRYGFPTITVHRIELLGK